MEISTKVNTQQSHYTVIKVTRKRQIQRSSQTKINKNIRKRVGRSKIEHGLTNTCDVDNELNLKLYRILIRIGLFNIEVDTRKQISLRND